MILCHCGRVVLSPTSSKYTSDALERCQQMTRAWCEALVMITRTTSTHRRRVVSTVMCFQCEVSNIQGAKHTFSASCKRAFAVASLAQVGRHTPYSTPSSLSSAESSSKMFSSSSCTLSFEYEPADLAANHAQVSKNKLSLLTLASGPRQTSTLRTPGRPGGHESTIMPSLSISNKCFRWNSNCGAQN